MHPRENLGDLVQAVVYSYPFFVEVADDLAFPDAEVGADKDGLARFLFQSGKVPDAHLLKLKELFHLVWRLCGQHSHSSHAMENQGVHLTGVEHQASQFIALTRQGDQTGGADIDGVFRRRPLRHSQRS